MVRAWGSSESIRFGVFAVNLNTGELRKNGVRVRLPDQPFQVLALLLQRPGEVVTRDEIRQELWPDGTFVDFEHGLNAAINRLRDVLDDSSRNPHYIETLPRRGYRFIAPVERVGTAEPTGSAFRASWLWEAGIFLAALALLTVALNVGGLRNRLLGAPAPGEITSIAVLPLISLAEDGQDEPFVDGMTEELITQLSKLSALERVISRQSVMQYKATNKSLPEIAQELSVDALIEGSVLRSGNRVRINVQLIRANPEQHLWAESYERELGDVLALQKEVTRAVAKEIRLTLTPREEEHLAEARPVNPEAHAAYLRGRYFWNKRTAEGYSRAIEHFQEAIEIDPDYALAYAGLADTYVLWVDPSPEEANRRARAAATKALELEDDLAEAYATLAFADVYDWNWDEAEKGFRRAIELNPNYATAHQWYGSYLSWLGRYEEAIAEVKRARELDPLSLVQYVALGFMCSSAGKQDEAMTYFREAFKLDPSFLRARKGLAAIYLLQGEHEKALTELEWLADHFPDPEEQAGLAYGYALAGRESEARGILRQLARTDELSWRQFGLSVLMARIHAGLGEEEEALHWLHDACDKRSWRLTNLKTDPAFYPLADHPRFQDLLRRMNLPE